MLAACRWFLHSLDQKRIVSARPTKCAARYGIGFDTSPFFRQYKLVKISLKLAEKGDEVFAQHGFLKLLKQEPCPKGKSGAICGHTLVSSY